MYIAPDSTIEFYNVKLDKSYNDTIFFGEAGTTTTLAKQRAYFNSHIIMEIDNNSYIRKDNGVIYVERTTSALSSCDYIGFTNLEFENKWFYAFIDRIEYVNNETTAVYFTIDVMQTWFTFATVKQSFIVREHVQNDIVYSNIIDEEIGIGDVIQYFGLDACKELRDMVAVAVSLFKKDGSSQAPITTVNGVYQGLNYLIFSSTSDLQTWLYKMTDNGNINDITSIFMFPKAMIKEGGYSPTIYKTFDKPDRLSSGYIPKNKKLLNYPYNFLQVTNNEGNTAVYRYERFGPGAGQFDFHITASVSGTPTVAAIPVSYGYTGRESEDVQLENFSEMLTLQSFPQCSWAIDTYRAYCALNQNTLSNMANVQFPLMRQHAIAAGAESGLSAFTALTRLDAGGAFKGAAGTYFAIKDTEAEISAKLAQLKDLDLQPPQIAGNVASSVTASRNYKTFEFRECSIPTQQAQIIDNYFELYGYKVNRFGSPAWGARKHWYYIKTLYTNIDGYIPADDLSVIKQIFENGIRFWFSGDELGNYELDNHEGVPT